MEKKFIMKEIKRMMKECKDVQLLHLIYLVLIKADKIDLTAVRCSDDSSDNA
jgi:hypothetical protein